MLKIWGRADGSNVIKAMWRIGELGIAHERIDWGGEFGGNDDPQYRRKNPNGRLPTLDRQAPLPRMRVCLKCAVAIIRNK